MAIRAGATVFPLAKPLNAVLTPELATEVSKAIAQHRKTADRRLLSQPMEELSTLLLQSLNAHLSGCSRPVVLIFDEFELVSVEVEQWLREILSGTFGTSDASVRVVIAGRRQISQEWVGRGSAGSPAMVLHLPLDVFTADEVARYIQISKPGLSAPEAFQIAERLDSTYRLPLALRLLVATPATRLKRRTVGWASSPTNSSVACLMSGTQLPTNATLRLLWRRLDGLTEHYSRRWRQEIRSPGLIRR